MAKKKWQVQEAKAQFSRVVKQAVTEGPQNITVRGEPAVVMISVTEYEKLTHKQPSFVEFMRNSPLTEIELDLKRDKSSCREIEL